MTASWQWLAHHNGGLHQLVIQLPIRDLYKALEQHACRNEVLRAPYGERKIDGAVREVVAPHCGGLLVAAHTPTVQFLLVSGIPLACQSLDYPKPFSVLVGSLSIEPVVLGRW